MSETSRINSLVQAFRNRYAELTLPQTLEATIRLEFIDPFWQALGWDVTNSEHRSGAEKDVSVEPPLKSLTEENQYRQRRPDYMFRINGFPRFVVEAKKASIDLRNDRDAPFQAKSYAWNSQIPFAILTNFRHFQLFDATLKPIHADPKRGLIADFDLTYEDYLGSWETLTNTFSKTCVLEGSLEALLAKIKHIKVGRRIRGIDNNLLEVRGTEPVDKSFLSHLQSYRERFAISLYKDNKKEFKDADKPSGAAKLSEATQRLMDRVVFLRSCEDRGITTYGDIKEKINDAVESVSDPYAALVEIFRSFDSRFNGFLFKPHFSEHLSVNSELLVAFVASLYPLESPYRFDLIGDDLLGKVYEQFLGSTIRVLDGQVVIEEKPEVRHAGGVVYTPTFIVETIVALTLNPILKNKTLDEILQTRILDPACGSGSFLIVAYQHLLKHCSAMVQIDPTITWLPKGKRKAIVAGVPVQSFDLARKSEWVLSAELRSALLASCIYGVDIDAQAVEVTIMSLYLKALDASGTQRSLWKNEHLLPPLDGNIRCGNSLIDPSSFQRFWEEEHKTLFSSDPELDFRVNSFDWDSDNRGFGSIIGSGFDCIIGNPPYIRIQELRKWAPEECEFYGNEKYFKTPTGSYDIYIPFIEKALSLLSSDGLLGFICPHKYWQLAYGKKLRGLLAHGKALRRVIDFGDQQVFEGRSTYTAIQIFSREDNEMIDFYRVKELTEGHSQCLSIVQGTSPKGYEHFQFPHPTDSEPWFFHASDHAEMLEHISDGKVKLFPEIADKVFQGVVTGADEVFLFPTAKVKGRVAYVFSEASGVTVPIEAELLRPVTRRKGFRAYVPEASQWLLFPYTLTGKLLSEELLENKYPKTWAYLNLHKAVLDRREARKKEVRRKKYEKRNLTPPDIPWWGYSGAKNLVLWQGRKLMVPYMLSHLESAFDEGGAFFVNVTTGGYGLSLVKGLPPGFELYLLGLLNSELLNWWLRARSQHFQGGYFPANPFILDLPIILPSSKEEKRLSKSIQDTVVEILKSLDQSVPNPSDHEVERVARRRESLKARLDTFVYELYGISPSDLQWGEALPQPDAPRLSP